MNFAIEERKDEIMGIAQHILRNPETGFGGNSEQKTRSHPSW